MAEVAMTPTRRTRNAGARLVIGTVVTVLAVGLGLFLVWDQIPSPSSILDLLAAADPGWLAVALAAEITAVASFSVIQRRLVINLGGNLSRRRSVKLTLASGAISAALPAGAALGAGYTYRRLRRSGLRSTDAGITMVASAGMLTGALFLLYVVLTGPTLLAELSDVIGHRHVGALVVLAGAILLFLIRRPSTPSPPSTPTPKAPGGRVSEWMVQYARTSRATFKSIPAAAWRISSVFAIVKWAADFAVLVAATFAVGASVDFVALATVYVGVQILRQIPFTPGGLGLIEAALLAGLIAAGSAAAPAAAAVVIYRALTFWLILPAGALAAMFDRVPVPILSTPAESVITTS